MLRPRVDASSAALALAAGDAVLIGLFVLAGEFQHYPTAELALSRWPGTLWPFLLGWAVFGALAGAFSRDALATPRAALVRVVPAWLAADLLAQGIRVLQPTRDADLAFFVVAAVMGFVLLGAWRALAAYVR